VRYSLAENSVEEHKVVGSPVVRGLQDLRPLETYGPPNDSPIRAPLTARSDSYAE
jgi:hypothetical protein